MRRIKQLLLTMMLALPAIVSAEIPAWETDVRYMGEMHVGYGTTANPNGFKTYMGRAMLGTIQGVSISNYLSAGIGVDAMMMTHKWEGEDLRFAVTMYTDVRGYYPFSDKLSVFLDLGLGAGLNVHPFHDNDPWFFCQFGPGIKYRKFNFSCGLQQMDTGDSGLSTFYVKTGIYF